MTPTYTGLVQYCESYWIDGELIRQKNLKILSEYLLEPKMHIYYTQVKISILLQYVAISFSVDVCILHFMSFVEVFIAAFILPYSVFFHAVVEPVFVSLTCGLDSFNSIAHVCTTGFAFTCKYKQRRLLSAAQPLTSYFICQVYFRSLCVSLALLRKLVTNLVRQPKRKSPTPYAMPFLWNPVQIRISMLLMTQLEFRIRKCTGVHIRWRIYLSNFM